MLQGNFISETVKRKENSIQDKAIKNVMLKLQILKIG